jgi:hypothetical protein
MAFELQQIERREWRHLRAASSAILDADGTPATRENEAKSPRSVRLLDETVDKSRQCRMRLDPVGCGAARREEGWGLLCSSSSSE